MIYYRLFFNPLLDRQENCNAFFVNKILNCIFQGLASFIQMLLFTIPLILIFNILETSKPAVALLSCLGRYEMTFNKDGGHNLCTEGEGYRKIICQISFLVFEFLSSNIPEAVLLFLCFKEIKDQDERVQSIISKKDFIKRRR